MPYPPFPTPKEAQREIGRPYSPWEVIPEEIQPLEGPFPNGLAIEVEYQKREPVKGEAARGSDKSQAKPRRINYKRSSTRSPLFLRSPRPCLKGTHPRRGLP